MKKKLMLLNKTSLTTLSLLFSYEPFTNTWASSFPIDPSQEIIEPLASFPNTRKQAFNSLQSLFMNEEKDIIQGDNLLEPTHMLFSEFMKKASQEAFLFETIESKSLSYHILFSLLAISSKATANSFIVTSQGELIEKHRGSGLLPPVIYSISEANQKTEHHLGLRNILFCIPELTQRKIDKEVRDYFLGLCPEKMILTWLGYLERQSQESGKPFKLVSGTALKLLRRFKNMQAFMEDKPDLTHEGLFSKLYPLVHRYYQELIKTYSLEERASLLFDEENRPIFESFLPLRARLINEEKLEGEVIFKALRKETASYPPQEQFITNTSLQEAQEILKAINLNFIKKDHAQEQTLLTAAEYFSSEIATYAHKSWKNPKLVEKVMRGDFSAKVRPVLASLGINLKEALGSSQVHVDLRKLDWQECLTALLNEGFSLDEKDSSYQSKTPLDITMENNEYEKVNFLISNGACKVSVQTALTYFKNIPANDDTSQKSFKILETHHPELLWQRTVDTLLPTQSKGLPIQTATLGTRSLSQTLLNQLFKVKKQINEVNKTGRRSVGRIESEGYCLYIKEYPELPGLEQAVHYMAHHLIGYGTPFGELIRIGDRPYYISQGINGDTLQEVLDKYSERLKDLDPESTWSMILLAMLIQPEDGKPDNYIVEPLPNGKYRLVAIDNDHAFGPDFERADNGIIPHTKSVLFLLEQMNDPLSGITRKIIENLNAGEFLLKMLADLSILNTAYYTLFKEEKVRKRLMFQKLGSLIGVAFAPHMVSRLYERIVDLQDILETQKKVSSFTYKDLLKKLQPRLARRYHAALEKYTLPSSQIPPIAERFKNSDWQFYKHDKANHSVSSRDLKGIAQTTLNIPLKAELLKQVQEGGELGPAAARVELEQIIQETESKSDLRWDIETFYSYKTDKKRYEFFDKIDFKDPSLNQQAWIRAFQTIPNLHQLIIRGSTALSKKDFNLKNGFSLVNLKGLDISGSTQLEDSFMTLLAEHAKVLEILIASDLKNLNFFQGYQRSSYLALSSNEIHLTFPSLINLDLSQCINLQTIRLEAPKLAYFEAQGCSNLITLDLKTPQLKEFDLRQAQRITDYMLETQLVDMFQLDHLKLEGYGGKFYQEFHGNFPTYPLYLLANCRTKYYPKELREKAIIPLLQHSSLTSLDISRTYINEARAKALAEAFVQGYSLSLTNLNLNLTQIGDEGAKALAKVFAQGHLPSLTNLSLGGNQIGEEGAKALAEAFVQGHLPSLTSLYINSNEIGNEGAKALADVFTQGHLPSLTSLYISSNKIGNEGAQALADVFTQGHLSSLTSLELGYNPIGNEGAQALADVFTQGHLSSLRSFHLGSNEIGNTGMQALANAFAQGHLSSLTSLNISFNKVGNTGMQALANAFAQGHLSSLTSLNISHNEIGEAGAKALTDAFAQGHLPSLTSLDLSRNDEIGNAGAQALADILVRGHLSSLTYLSLICPNISKNLGKKIDALLERNNKKQISLEKISLPQESSLLEKKIPIERNFEKQLEGPVDEYVLKSSSEEKHEGHHSFWKHEDEIEENSPFFERKNEPSKDEYVSQNSHDENEDGLSSSQRIDYLEERTSELAVDHSLLDEDLARILATSQIEEETFIPQDLFYDVKDPLYNDWYYAGLSVDGGGIRGKIPATMMSQLEKCSDKKIYQLFDYVGGTSVGGILSLGTMVSDDMYNPLWSASDLEELFNKYGTHIFPPSSWIGGLYKIFSQLWTARYAVEPLEALLQSYFKDYNLSDALKPVLVTALKQNNGTPTIYKSTEAQKNMYNDYLMWQIARVTSAAPTYFQGMGVQNLMGSRPEVGFDGGVWHNNPSDWVYNGIVKLYENASQTAHHQNIKMVSLGTGSAPIAEFKKNSGLLKAIAPITEVPMAAGAEGVHLGLKELLPSGNYYRFQPTLKDAIDLADTSKGALHILDTMAHLYDEEIEILARYLAENSERRHRLAL